jgi:hypothetical protein
MNGQGYYKAASGYCYEGVFANGVPKNMSTKLKIEIFDKEGQTSKFKIVEGKTLFGIKVVSLNENDEVFRGNMIKNVKTNKLKTNKFIHI